MGKDKKRMEKYRKRWEKDKKDGKDRKKILKYQKQIEKELINVEKCRK
jgi:hypothetical protein